MQMWATVVMDELLEFFCAKCKALVKLLFLHRINFLWER